jgi:hypothetical protein
MHEAILTITPEMLENVQQNLIREPLLPLNQMGGISNIEFKK